MDATLFVVRVWRANGFRASVRRVDDEDTRLFKSAGELARYLEASCAARMPDVRSDSARAAPPKSDTSGDRE